jgi:predicted flap endonuclease-1-like 5' DNA nuclease
VLAEPQAEMSIPEAELPEAELPEVELPRVELTGVEPELETEDMMTPAAAAAGIALAKAREEPLPETQVEQVAAFAAEPAAEEARLPEVEITEEVPAEAAAGTPAGAQAELPAAAIVEETGVPEPELASGVAASLPVAAEQPAAAPAPDLNSLQAQLAALQAQLSALQAQISQGIGGKGSGVGPGAAAGAAAGAIAASAKRGAEAPEVILPDVTQEEVVEELPEEPPVEPPTAEKPIAGKLPGSDEVARIAAEMNAMKPKPAPAAEESAPVAGEDDLESIEGVGPIYAKRLREFGITTYDQLASASYQVLEKVTRGNLERVVREDWRGQARRRMAQK